MDRAALRFIEMLDDDRLGADGLPLVDVAMKFRLFERGSSWLAQRHKLKPQGEDSEGSGIRSMREWMADPESVAALDQVMFERLGYVKVPEKTKGRPPKAHAAVRERYKEHAQAAKADTLAGSGWSKMLQAKDDEQ